MLVATVLPRTGPSSHDTRSPAATVAPSATLTRVMTLAPSPVRHNGVREYRSDEIRTVRTLRCGAKFPRLFVSHLDVSSFMNKRRQRRSIPVANILRSLKNQRQLGRCAPEKHRSLALGTRCCILQLTPIVEYADRVCLVQRSVMQRSLDSPTVLVSRTQSLSPVENKAMNLRATGG